MFKYLIVAFVVAAAGYAYAQVYTGPPNPTAFVCAYNSAVPAPTAGKFFYVQCDSTGRIRIK